MFKRRKAHNEERAQREQAADEALKQSIRDYESLQTWKPVVEATVRGHLTLQQENHFAERMWWAYRGESVL